LILALTNHVEAHAKSVSEGDWERSVDWSYSNTPLIELAGKTLGIVGLGSIGEQTARIAKAFGMTVIYNNRKKKQTDVAEYVSLDSLFEESDFISLHCPLTEENREFVNASLLRRMKPSAFIVNTARGQLINEKDLAERLNKGTIAGAGLDVLSKEPPTDGNPLLNAKNCIITPHNAWKTKEARIRVINVTAENIKSFMENRPVNVVTM
jgi:glycerate dehydrogenase